MPGSLTLCTLGSWAGGGAGRSDGGGLAGAGLWNARRGGSPSLFHGLDSSLAAEIAIWVWAAGSMEDGGRDGPCCEFARLKQPRRHISCCQVWQFAGN